MTQKKTTTKTTPKAKAKPKATPKNTPIRELKGEKSAPKKLTFEFTTEELQALGKIFDIAVKGGGLYAAQPVSHFMQKFGMQVKDSEG